MSSRQVAVVGAGASGTIQALHLLREGIEKVTLIEREREPGRGVAYGTRRPEHLLNVTAGRMIVYPDDPGHFARWFGRIGGEPEDYAPRMLFGDYLEALMAEAGDRLQVVRGEAVRIDGRGPFQVQLREGGALEAESVVLALGNLRPAVPPGIEPSQLGELLVDDPWFGGIVENLSEDHVVLVVGTGLTAIDAALTLDASGFRGRIVAISRRGLAPRAHLKRDAVGGVRDSHPTRIVAMLRSVRRRVREIGWREAVHELRPVTQTLWSQAPLEERRRFIRHLRPYWDVHRHRIAPGVAARIERMKDEGRLTFAAGRIVSAVRDGDAARVLWRARHEDREQALRVSRIVNCTGPDLDIARCRDPLLSSLVSAGRIRPDECRLGLEVDGSSRVVARDGTPSDHLSAIGPITRGAFWESIAVPDIAAQAQAVARRIAGRAPA
ncbi:MAG TPA: FAD/NAD(P)-binding protein [Allosphingosinicella sp.]|nr:FAD/NAD(P)-binding protein [Allosphingosinicella sp.]